MVTQLRKSKKDFSQTIFFSALLAALILVVIGFLVISNWKINQRRAELNSKIEALKKEIQILEEKKQQLQAGISKAGTRDYLEKVAREQFGLQYPGEEVVVITKEKKEKQEIKEEKSFWKRFLEKIGF